MDSPEKTAPVRILVVEDVDFNREILTGMLTERGWQTITAKSGEAALATLADDQNFQIILMDVGLPGMDGIETTRKIKENPAAAKIPVLALTAEPASERPRLLAAGLDGYLEKNFDPDALYCGIEKQLALMPARKDRAQSVAPACAPSHILNLAALENTYGDEDIVRIIARAFFTDTDILMRRLGEAMAKADMPIVLACCHGIKGAATIFTADDLARLAEKLNLLIRDGTKSEVTAAHQEMQEAYHALRCLTKKQLKMQGDA